MRHVAFEIEKRPEETVVVLWLDMNAEERVVRSSGVAAFMEDLGTVQDTIFYPHSFLDYDYLVKELNLKTENIFISTSGTTFILVGV